MGAVLGGGDGGLRLALGAPVAVGRLRPVEALLGGAGAVRVARERARQRRSFEAMDLLARARRGLRRSRLDASRRRLDATRGRLGPPRGGLAARRLGTAFAHPFAR